MTHEDQACILREAAPHIGLPAHSLRRFLIQPETVLLKLSDPVITPLAVNVMVAGLARHCGGNEDALAAFERHHEIRYVLLFHMLHKFCLLYTSDAADERSS